MKLDDARLRQRTLGVDDADDAIGVYLLRLFQHPRIGGGEPFVPRAFDPGLLIVLSPRAMFAAEHADVGALIVLDVATLASAVGRHASLHEANPVGPPLHGAESLNETDRFESHL